MSYLTVKLITVNNVTFYGRTVTEAISRALRYKESVTNAWIYKLGDEGLYHYNHAIQD